MVEGLAPGDWVTNPHAPEWGLGQVQSVIGDRVTANFENAGKRLINARRGQPHEGRTARTARRGCVLSTLRVTASRCGAPGPIFKLILDR